MMNPWRLRKVVEDAIGIFFNGEVRREVVQLDLETGKIIVFPAADFAGVEGQSRKLVFDGKTAHFPDKREVHVLWRHYGDVLADVLFFPENNRFVAEIVDDGLDPWRSAFAMVYEHLESAYFPCRGKHANNENEFTGPQVWRRKVRHKSCDRCPHNLACITANWKGLWYYDEANHKPGKLEILLTESLAERDRKSR